MLLFSRFTQNTYCNSPNTSQSSLASKDEKKSTTLSLSVHSLNMILTGRLDSDTLFWFCVHIILNVFGI